MEALQNAIGGGHPHRAVGCGTDAGCFKIRLRIKGGYAARLLAVPVQRKAADKPDVALLVGRYLADRQIGCRLNHPEGFRQGEVLIQTLLGADPQSALFIFIQRLNEIVADAFRFIGVVAKDFKVVTVEAVQAIFCAEPKKAPFVLQAADHRVVREAIFYLVMLKGIGLPKDLLLKEQDNHTQQKIAAQEQSLNVYVKTKDREIEMCGK